MLGFHGQGVNLAVMDSGALLYKHPELNGDRFHATHATEVAYLKISVTV